MPKPSADPSLNRKTPIGSRVNPKCLSIAFLAALAILAIDDTMAQARTVLHGGTTHTDYVEVPVYGSPYYPRQGLVLQGDRLAEDYKLQAAEALYRKALRQNPQNAGALNGLGKIAYYKTTSSNQNLRNRKDELYSQAMGYFLAAIRLKPGYVEAHVNLASVYLSQNRLADAEDEVSRAIRLAPSDSGALAVKGEWLVLSHRSDEALPYLKRAIKMNPGSVTAHYYLGVAQIDRNELDAALQNFNTTLWLQPDNGNAHYQMAQIYEKQGNGAAAVEHYRKALASKPELTEARLKLADYYEHRGDTPAALEQLKSTLDSSSPDWDLTDRTAKLSIRNEQPEQAVKLYRAWLNEHPEDKDKVNPALSYAKTQLAVKKLRDNDLISQGEAHRYAEQAIKAEPNNFEARMIKVKLDREIGSASPLPDGPGKSPGEIDAALGQTDFQPYQSYEKGELLLARYQFREAEQAFRNARRAGEGKRTAMHFGELFLAKGLPNLAEESFQEVLAQAPRNASARLGMAKAREAKEQSRVLFAEAKLEHKKEALPVAILLLQRSLQANVENSQAHYMLGQIYEKKEDYTAAADQYYAYLQLEPMADNAESVRNKIEQMKRKAREQKENAARNTKTG